MQKDNKEYLIKAYTFLNDLYSKVNDPREMYDAWSKLKAYMGISDGAEARRLLVIWKNASGLEF